MIATSTVVAAALLAALAVTGVAALTIWVERAALRFQNGKRSLPSRDAEAGDPAVLVKADNAWLSAIVRTFDEAR